MRKHSHTKSESLAQIRITMLEIQHFFSGIFYIGACKGSPKMEKKRSYIARIQVDASASGRANAAGHIVMGPLTIQWSMFIAGRRPTHFASCAADKLIIAGQSTC